MTCNRRLAAGLLTAAGLIAMLGGCTPAAPADGDASSRAQTPATTGTAAPPPPPEEAVTDPVTGVLCVNANLTGKTDSQFELPLAGATGYASVPLSLTATAGGTDKTAELKAGEAFRILEEQGDSWRVETRNGASGWVPHRYAFVNLPDILPSIVYDITNADASVFVSAGKDIPGITGQKLYDSRMLNERLEDNEYLVPVLYAMAKKIAAAQKAALAKGDTLVIVETFRPLDTQLLVAKQLGALSDADSEVRRGISTAPWGIGWFIANQVSTHQKGCAMDVTLAKLKTVRRYRSGAYVYSRASLYEPYEMPTPIHELSSRAVSLAEPVNSRSATAWKAVAAAPTMNEPALKLRQYCTDAGLSPLASEWWHFNDLEANAAIGSRYMTTAFQVADCLTAACP